MEKTKYLIEGPISTEIISQAIKQENSDTSAGAQSIFLGQVRNDTIDSKTVSKIVYNAYEEMLLTEIQKIESAIYTEFPDVHNVIIKHSKGEVACGEISLLVLVSGGHRLQATKACNKTVELIKENLPVWKKEYFEGTEKYHWRENG